MIICLTAENNTMESPIAKRFGHAPWFLLYNTETRTFVPMKNENAEGHHSVKKHKHNHHEHPFIKDLQEYGAEIFIVGNIGPQAFNELNIPGVEVFHARKMTAGEALEMFQQGKLKKLDEPTAKKSIGHGKHS